MKARISMAFALGLALAGCNRDDKGGALKEGQVVATVGGEEITISELNAELQGANLPNEQAREQARKAALEALVNRTILTNIARERKLDQSPTYVNQKRRAEEALLVQLLQRDIAAKVPPPNRAEAVDFMNKNPDLFAQRKIFSLDQIEFAPPPGNTTLLKSLEPLKTMEQVEAALIEQRVKYRRGTGRLDTVGVDPNLIRKIVQLPAGEIFVLPNQGTLVANRIVKSEVVPFTGDEAVNYATGVVQNQKIGQAADRELKAKIDEAKKTVKYQAGFAPAATPAAPAAR